MRAQKTHNHVNLCIIALLSISQFVFWFLCKTGESKQFYKKILRVSERTDDTASQYR